MTRQRTAVAWSDGDAALPAGVHVSAMRLFAAGAVVGAVIALTAPVAFMSVLGVVAATGGVLGLLLHFHLLRHDHAVVWIVWHTALRSRYKFRRASLDTGASRRRPAAGGTPVFTLVPASAS